MEQQLSPDIIAEFESITQFPLTDYMIVTNGFLNSGVQNIISYYGGNSTALSKDAQNTLQSLIDQTENLFAVITLNKNSFINYKWWILIDALEQTQTLLLKLNSASRWLRSARTEGSFNSNPEITIALKQGQKLEDLQRNVLGSDDWDNTWTDLAQKNDLEEEDYTSNGGILLKANFNYALNNFKINSIVDNPVDESILGIDVANKLEFDTDEQDLVVLTPKETFTQNISNLINLKKGDNPEFPNQGISPNLIVGSNVNSLSYPSLFRQLIELFKSDDTIKSFTLNSIRRQQDGVFIDFNVESRLGDLQQVSMTI